MNTLAPANCEFITTEDGSPSMCMTYPSGVAERMHHFRGAFTESVYIYGSAVDLALTEKWPPSFLSVGLGLGYNEFLAAGACLARQTSLDQIVIDSYETEPILKESLSLWLEEHPIDTNFAQVYDQILTLTARHFSLQPARLKQTLRDLLSNGKWNLRNAFSAAAPGRPPYSCIMYDAFSAKMDPELWSEESLTAILQRCAGPHCVFATYAATGALKRALKSQGFAVERRLGFGGKKESTLARR